MVKHNVSMATKSKLSLLAILFVLILMMSACSGRSSWPWGPKSHEDDDPFVTNAHTGTYGVVMRFTRENPARTVYYTGDPTPFDLVVEIRNRGAYDISNGWLYLTGFDKNIIQPFIVAPSGKTLPLFFAPMEGVSNFNPEGDISVVEFRNDIVSWPEGTDKYEPKVKIYACYEYETVANPIVCIDPHPFSSLEEDKVCRVQNVGMAGGQGAPVQITSIEEEATEKYVYFKIHIANANANGQVYDWQRVSYASGRDDTCPFNIQYTDKDKVHYEPPVWEGSADSAPQLESCKPPSPVKLVDGQATILCKYTIPEGLDEVYQTPFNIKLHYGYMNYEEQTIRIVNVAES
ncbi:MAG: hypothetical protein QS98_C0005G0106 [archaeon GW2011_AR3]|nr:MAG: hypothetical protein QS98_C0005G0106 [archaeon GW2011_AR3]MBS3109388.1 hypothetical protein [Candidatus Woesearchaeota archaeon]